MNESNAQEVSAKRRRFSEPFQRDAVRLVTEEKYSFKAVATAVGVTDQTLRAWHAKFAPKPDPCGEEAGLPLKN